MKKSPVESSAIKAVGYDETKKELHVDFHGTGTYIYDNVQPATHRAMMEADSIGKFVHNYVKGYHPHRKA